MTKKVDQLHETNVTDDIKYLRIWYRIASKMK